MPSTMLEDVLNPRALTLSVMRRAIKQTAANIVHEFVHFTPWSLEKHGLFWVPETNAYKPYTHVRHCNWAFPAGTSRAEQEELRRLRGIFGSLTSSTLHAQRGAPEHRKRRHWILRDNGEWLLMRVQCTDRTWDYGSHELNGSISLSGTSLEALTVDLQMALTLWNGLGSFIMNTSVNAHRRLAEAEALSEAFGVTHNIINACCRARNIPNGG